ncbi:pirin family protein [Aerophototrophica crusticola]|uniref:Pirin family protein n=1 Tax=Aerophototrophica crusticola TaxID=1709002 RepID=A0A858R8U3_9PROT|nr:pirin family protein [Rhodospirillaceae bacterium B3]
MSWQPAQDPWDEAGMCPALEAVIVPRARDLGGFEVRRALPSAKRQMVGPFIFWDQMGPATFQPGTGIDVRPHPHIGLATVTYLFEGEIMHRDSLGTVQPIRPGELNWMTAGRGIAHSERTDTTLRGHANPMFGIQSWVALPERFEETDPGFAHFGAADLPVVEGEGKRARIIAGSLFGATSPAPSFSAMFYADVSLDPGAAVALPAEHEERAIYVAQGSITIAGDRHEAGQLLLFRPGDAITVRGPEAGQPPARLLFLGGEPMDGPRHIWWNFVSSRKDRIDQAKADWKAGRFPAVPGEHEFIPLPD